MTYERIHDNIGKYNGRTGLVSNPKIKKEPRKAEILDFMLKQVGDGLCASKVYDHITGERTNITERMYFFKEYAWTETDMYHFEKYDMELKESFLEEVFANVV